ncbi:KRAB [Lepeophtheirus salmonis]|uniref:KRAB n=2 Tax=Lepeophtheirus salmonis TaxID=72036 RepID=A0A7R8HB29_LEPSM|nr:KRAB [Lepeophtheirus salmonis]CAF2975197.1 KRAB [Lepeophtheirus salmonis]
MGSLSDIRDNLVSRYSSLGSCESIQKNDGSSFLLIRPSIIELSGYLPKLYVVVELETVKLLSYHGKVLKEEKLDGGHILDRINEGKLFMCLGIGNQTLNDSLLKDVYSEPSKREGEIAFRSRQCSFFLENTPGLCNECQSLLTTLNNMEDSYENDSMDYDWTLSELKEEDGDDEAFDDSNYAMNLNECSKCFKTFKSSSSLNRHKRKCLNYLGTNEKKSKLKKEEEEDYNEDNVTLHKCMKCHKTFNNTSSLNRHKRRCPNDPGVNEKIISELKEEEVFNEDNVTTNECSKCLETFNSISLLNRHEDICLKDPDFREEEEISKRTPYSIDCSICLLKLTTKSSYIRHTNLHEERMNLKEVINCPLCEQSLDNRKLLNPHIHESHDASKGCCVLCFEIVLKEHLPRHFEKRHNYNQKKHLCSECGKKFTFPSDLQNHIAYAHDLGGEKSVVCDQCGKVLSHRKALMRHIRRSHNKSRSYTCPKCNKVFFEKYRLTNHLKIHAGLKPFKCARCEYCCLRKSNMYIHLRRVHKIVPTSNDVVTIAEQIKLMMAKLEFQNAECMIVPHCQKPLTSCLGQRSVVPRSRTTTRYLIWKKDIRLWQKFTDIDKKKQTIGIRLSLNVRSREATTELKDEIDCDTAEAKVKKSLVNEQGEVTRCNICKSEFHWQEIGRKEGRENVMAIEEKQKNGFTSILTAYAEEDADNKLEELLQNSKGKALLNSGCACTTCGWTTTLKNMSKSDRMKMEEFTTKINLYFW